MASHRDPFDLLVFEGATPEQASRIIDTLLACGVRRPRIRQWLAHPQLCYPMLMGLITKVPGPPIELRNAPILAVPRQADLVIALAKEFAEADPRTREVALAFACNLEKVDWLSRGEPERLDDLVAVTRLLFEKLGKNVHVADFAGWTFDPRWRHPFADRLASDELSAVPSELKNGLLDPWAILNDPRFKTTHWGPG